MRFPENPVKEFCAKIFENIGIESPGARVFADSLVESEMRGVVSHGVTRIKAYTDKITRGDIDPRARPFIVKESSGALLVDGNNGPGVVAATETMMLCVDRAAKAGSCFAAMNNTSHYAAGWYFAMRAALNGMIGFVVCNTNALMAPFGGAIPMLGTNPLSIAVPAGRMPALVLDMATSTVAKGKVDLYAKLGKKMPLGWVADKDGRATTNPLDLAEGALTPFGGAKGYGIALLIDVVCSALSGAKNGRQITSIFSCDDPDGYRGIGVFMGAIDISKFVALDVFKVRVDGIYDEFKNTPPAKDVKSVMLPGEIEFRNYEKNRAEGMELSDKVVTELKAVGAKYAVAWPF